MASRIPKAPRAVRLLAQFGADALRPSIVNGKYHGPLVKPRAAAMVRKRAVIEGTVGSFCQHFGGWLEEWDVQKKVFMPRANRGHLRERNRAQRADKITRAMTEQTKKVEAYREDVQSRRPDRSALYLFKDMDEVDVTDGTEEENPYKKAKATGKGAAGAKGKKKKK